MTEKLIDFHEPFLIAAILRVLNHWLEVVESTQARF
jgi:hypothetical protein